MHRIAYRGHFGFAMSLKKVGNLQYTKFHQIHTKCSGVLHCDTMKARDTNVI